MNEEADAETKLVSDHLIDFESRLMHLDLLLTLLAVLPSRRFPNVHISCVVNLKRSLAVIFIIFWNVNNWISVHKILPLVSFEKLPSQ